MNCDQTRELIFDNTALTGDKRSALHAHIDGCSDCLRLFETNRQVEQEFDSVRHTQANMQQKPLSESESKIMAGAMHRIHAIESQRRTTRHNFAMGTGLGFALAVSLFIALFGNTILTGIDNDISTPISNIRMTANVQRSVNIMFDSPEAVTEATITIYLPEHISIAGYDEMHELSWKTALKAGKNSLKIPLLASRDGKGIIRSELKVGDDTRAFQLAVDVDPNAGHTSNLHLLHG